MTENKIPEIAIIGGRHTERTLKAHIDLLEELEQYRAIGTVEEFKALKEKQIPKKIVINNIPKTSWTKATTKYTCPSCDRVIGFNGLNYCSCCGQKLDWGYE